MTSDCTILQQGDPPAAGDGPLIAVGMSGGVDSSTVAALLSREHRVVGMTMQLWDQRRMAALDPSAPASVEGRCCSTGDVYDARRVAEHLRLPFYVVNHERQFEEAVVRPFVEDYMNGRTPIPCALCNNHVKFGALLDLARQVGAERLATGHYARIERDATSGRYLLRRAVDESKDQSYFLFGLTQEQLSHTLFPLGSLRKDQVRKLAEEFQLPVARKPESQEICFVPDGDYARFVETYAEAYRPQQDGRGRSGGCGEIRSLHGEILGQHRGIFRYTVGQRKGLGVGTGTPLYVLSIDPASQSVTVGENEHLFRRTCRVRDVNWIAHESPPELLSAQVKIRRQHRPAPATLRARDNLIEVEFEEPQRAITPGQAAVFYDGDLVLGGGWIV